MQTLFVLEVLYSNGVKGEFGPMQAGFGLDGLIIALAKRPDVVSVKVK